MSVAFALPTNSAPAPANSVIAIFLMVPPPSSEHCPLAKSASARFVPQIIRRSYRVPTASRFARPNWNSADRWNKNGGPEAAFLRSPPLLRNREASAGRRLGHPPQHLVERGFDAMDERGFVGEFLVV